MKLLKFNNIKVLFLGLAVSLVFNLYFLLKPYLSFTWLDSLFKADDSLDSGVVARVIDGDTFDLDNKQRIRLAGANAPEYPKGCLSLEAKNRLEQLILGKKVSLQVITTDNFSRQVAYIFLNDVLIDKVLVEEGLALASPNSPKHDPLILSAQDQAKKLDKGIWSSLCQAKKDCLIKGNVRKDKNTKIYHLPECYNYPKIVIKESDGDLWFCTEKEALEAGFFKSQDCP